MNRDQARTALTQIGTPTVLAVSGGRWALTPAGDLDLPSGAGHHVLVHLDEGRDVYAVERVFARAGKVHRQHRYTDVYADTLSGIVYDASCWRDKPLTTLR